MLTPIDIENKKFAKQMVNGYSVDEVDDFLDEIERDYAKSQKDLADANRTVEELKADLEHYKSIESTLQGTLLMAQQTAEDVKNVARQQAEQILQDAKGATQKESEFLQSQILAKRKELEDLQKEFDIYKAKMESLLISQLELIKDINKNDNEF